MGGNDQQTFAEVVREMLRVRVGVRGDERLVAEEGAAQGEGRRPDAGVEQGPARRELQPTGAARGSLIADHSPPSAGGGAIDSRSVTYSGR